VLALDETAEEGAEQEEEKAAERSGRESSFRRSVQTVAWGSVVSWAGRCCQLSGETVVLTEHTPPRSGSPYHRLHPHFVWRHRVRSVLTTLRCKPRGGVLSGDGGDCGC
jgi:hypothetical protein